MTPQERATYLAESQCLYRHASLALVSTASDCSTCIAEQIHAAIVEEREACATIAASGCGECEHNSSEQSDHHPQGAEGIAAAIRARS